MDNRYKIGGGIGGEKVWVVMDLEARKPVHVFRDEFEAEDFADEYWESTGHDCIVKPSRLS